MDTGSNDWNDTFEAAAAAVRSGELIIYPTETVYGLGADALSPPAIERVYDTKGRSRTDPLSLAVPNIDIAQDYIDPSEMTLACMKRFLPGPVTVIAERDPIVPDNLTSGRDRVGIRIPDHELAKALLRRVAPITATSANRSGSGSVVTPDELDSSIREAAAVIIDGGETPGAESTVVEPDHGIIHRSGANSEAVEAWLREATHDS